MGKTMLAGCKTHLKPIRRRTRLLVTTGQFLTGDKIREEVREQPEQCQPRNTVRGQNPGAAPGKMTGM